MKNDDRPNASSGASGDQERGSSEPRSEPISLMRGKRPARILVLDDEEGPRQAIKVILGWTFKDYVLVECVNGDEALREIQRRPPDLLMTDYGHAGMRIDEMLHRLYRCPVRFPIIVDSAYVGYVPDLQKRLVTFPGFTVTLLNKPFIISDLVAQVRQHLVPSDGSAGEM